MYELLEKVSNIWPVIAFVGGVLSWCLILRYMVLKQGEAISRLFKDLKAVSDFSVAQAVVNTNTQRQIDDSRTGFDRIEKKIDGIHDRIDKVIGGQP